MNSGGTTLLDRFKTKRSDLGATPTYTGGQWLKEGQNLFSSGFVRVVSRYTRGACFAEALWSRKKYEEGVVVQAVIPVGEMETHKLQQWARTFQAYSHVRVHLLCKLASVTEAWLYKQ